MGTKYIFITGGVVSSLGKGIVGASIARLIAYDKRGTTVSLTKVDPYLNVDAGTMNPFQHGEVFVTADGAETDLDIGHYERFGIDCSAKNSITAGQIYESVLTNERKGSYLGQTVQVIPHVTNEIQKRIEEAGRDFDVAIVEIGGTVGDLEGLPFLEAIRQFSINHECKFVHVTLLPMVAGAGELKTKPTQHSVQKLREIGILPDAIICRSDHGLREEHRNKIALFCGVPKNGVFVSPTVKDIYSVPNLLAAQGIVKHLFDYECGEVGWKYKAVSDGKKIKVGMVGKYTDVRDAYKSIHEAVDHAGKMVGAIPTVVPIDSESEDCIDTLSSCDALIIPGGFGNRGIAGKIAACQFARQNGMPFLGICLGLQVAAIELLRSYGHDAQSEEFVPEHPSPAVAMLDGQKGRQIGASMRLGQYSMVFMDEQCREIYCGADSAMERHRHRYEFNPAWIDRLNSAGGTVCAVDRESGLLEVFRLREHPYYYACQFHPEFQSRPDTPHPLFVGLVRAAMKESA